jgi:hypothetical protein
MPITTKNITAITRPIKARSTLPPLAYNNAARINHYESRSASTAPSSFRRKLPDIDEFKHAKIFIASTQGNGAAIRTHRRNSLNLLQKTLHPWSLIITDLSKTLSSDLPDLVGEQDQADRASLT